MKTWMTLLALCAALTTAPAAAQERDLRHAGGVVLGVWGSIAVHEGGHALVAWAQGADEVSVRIPGPQCRWLCGSTRFELQRLPSAHERQAMAVAGFASANLVNEALLNDPRLVRSSGGQTFIAANLYSNVAHVLTYYTRRRGQDGYQGNDIDQYELAGGSPHLLSGVLLAYSAWTLQRLHQRQVPLFFAQAHF